VYAGPTPAGGLGRVVAEMTVSKKASTAALESFSQRLFRVATPLATQPVLSWKFLSLSSGLIRQAKIFAVTNLRSEWECNYKRPERHVIIGNYRRVL
jgi:hypothetical protein